jgi:hypothetical protein
MMRRGAKLDKKTARFAHLARPFDATVQAHPR